MRRGICGRADVLRALGQEDPSVTAAMVTLLGYHEKPPAEPEPSLPSAPAPRASRRKTPADIPYEPADVPFWRLETYEAIAHETPPGETLVPGPAPRRGWRKRPEKAPGFTPLAPRRTVLTRLRQVAATRRATAEIDVEATVERLSRGDLLQDVPYRSRRAWGAALEIIEDRARRLVPYWVDQEYVADLLCRLYPPHGVTIARLGDGDSEPVIRWPESRRGAYRLPAPHTLVVVLGDLGCLATAGEPIRRFWLHWGRLLRDNANPAIALVPMQLKEVPADLARVWTVVRWDAGTASGGDGALPATSEAVQRLLTLLSPVVRLEPGLLRAVRCLIPEGRRDAGLEARIWQDAAISSQHSVAATLDHEKRKAHLEHFSREPEALRKDVLSCVREWRARLHEAVWFAEVVSLDAQAQQTSVEPEDIADAVAFLAAMTEEVQGQRQEGSVVPISTLAWMERFTTRLPAAAMHDPHVRRAAHVFYNLVRPDAAETQVPVWYDPAELVSMEQTVRQVALWQVADQMVLQSWELGAPAERQAEVRGSPLGVVRTGNGDVTIEPALERRHDSAFWREVQPPAWAQRLGEDEYGAWVTFRVNEVEQRMRWIPPGRFLMGSPEEEEGRLSNEGPQHEVQLTQGFWLFDTPCTQALWQAVMGTNPSHFQGGQRPVENVTWRDCQRFLEQLNTLLPGLALCLPTEAQWEYACRAGTQTARYAEDVEAIAWYDRNSSSQTHEVRQKQANAWGLYDMLGNVWEWCHDGERRYTQESVVNPVGPVGAGADRVLRGGSWLLPARIVRAADRNALSPGYRNDSFGFRGASSGVSQPAGARAAWSMSKRQAEPAKTATRQPAARLLRLQQSTMPTALPEGENFVIRTDHEQLHFARMTRPAWATEIGRDAHGLWVVCEVKGVRQRLRWIPPGRFLMGSPSEEEGRYDDESPQHEVQLTQGFWLFDTPCTQALWQAVMGTNPSRFQGEQLPVERVSWEDCQQFLQSLCTYVPLPWCLPTEAQWEYACRAGTETARYDPELEDIAWYTENSRGTTHAVAQKRPNAWGLYDMLGNVLEWCYDGWRDYEKLAVVDPAGPLGADADRVLRGGSWGYPARGVRAALRGAFSPGLRYGCFGFRGASSGETSQ